MIHWIRAIATSIFNALLAPFRALKELGELAKLAAAPTTEQDHEEERKPLWQRLFLAPITILLGFASLLWQVVSYPFQGWFQDPLRRRNLLWGLPSIAVLLVFFYLIAQQSQSTGVAKSLYFKAFDEAEKEKEYAKARLLAQQLVRSGARTSPEAAFRFCKLLADDKDLERANAVIEILAPSNAPGYAPAHAQRAIAHAGLIARGAGRQLLEPLLWHLNHSNDRKDEKLALAWATYYQATQQFNEALRHLEIAAQANPEHWFSIANLMVVRGDMNNAQQALRLARDSYRRKLGEDPLSLSSRLRLVEAQIRLQQFDDAQQTIQAGIDFHPDRDELRQAQGTLEQAKLLAMQEQKAGDTELIEQVMLVMSYPEQQDFALDRMINMYSGMKPTGRQRIREILEKTAVENPSKPLVHLSLSTIALIEQRNEDAIALLEKTLELDAGLHLAKNNLAWLLAERNPPQMERAIRLAEEAVASLPNSPNYRDTLGTILFQNGDMDRAITELERALPNMPNEEKKKIYARLAKAYDSIGNASLAETYRARLNATP